MIIHTAGFTGSGLFRIFDVWETEQDWQRFNGERLFPAVQPLIESGATPPTEYVYELHSVVSAFPRP